jgi:two-component system cell cycle sensor histidine kinase/response regulator CckA
VLTAIIGYSEVLLSEMDSDARSRADIEQILKAGDRAKAITQQLLAFSRRQVLQPRVLNLNELIEDMQKMLERHWHGRRA